MSGVAFQLACNEVAYNNTAGTTVNDYEVEHFATVVRLHLTFLNLTVERSVSAEEELLTGLSLCIECTAHLGAAERTVCKKTAVFTRKRHTLLHALVDDIV